MTNTPDTPKRKRFPLKKKLCRLQNVIGRMKGVYLNDTGTMRADELLPLMDEAFNIIVEINSRCQ